MTKPDLSDVDAKLDWAVAQIEPLQAQIGEFFQEHTSGPWKESDPQGRGVAFMVTIDQPIPKKIQIEIGVIIHALRSSLDMSMVALAEHHGSNATNRVHFPILREANGLEEKPARKWLAEIDPVHADLIRALKPYKGGNDLLYALHWIDLKDKRRPKLIAVATGQSFAFGGMGHIRGYKLFSAEIGPQQNGIVGILDADPGINLDVAFDIALNEIEVINPRPVIAALHEFAGATKAVIDLFR